MPSPSSNSLRPSSRTTAMAAVEKRLGDQADASFRDAKVHGAQAADKAIKAIAAGADASDHALDALEDSLRAASAALKGSAIAAGGVAVRIAEELGDVVGAAIQQIGKGLLALGNMLRKLAGGMQVTTDAVEGEQDGPSLSDRLFAKSKAQFEAAAVHLAAALDDIISSGGDLKKAANNILAASTETLAAAKDLGQAGVVKTAEQAVGAARIAVDYAERGVDGAGAALQSAGAAMVTAGNAVNTARGDDTAVEAR